MDVAPSQRTVKPPPAAGRACPADSLG